MLAFFFFSGRIYDNYLIKVTKIKIFIAFEADFRFVVLIFIALVVLQVVSII